MRMVLVPIDTVDAIDTIDTINMDWVRLNR